MKKTLFILMMVLLSVFFIVSCDDKLTTSTSSGGDNSGSSNSLPTVSKKGDKIKLGKTQDGEEIEWRVLTIDSKNKAALLLSENILEIREFGSDTYYYYLNSTIREYLCSDEFLNTYGLSKDYMKSVDLVTDINKNKISDSGKDFVFLLSHYECTAGDEYYFVDKNDRIAKFNNEATAWWLRSEHSYIDSDGYQKTDNYPAKVGVRPAFWYTWE